MDVSSLFVKLLILGLPGLLGSLFYRKLRGGRKQKDWRDLAEITLFALSSYAVLGTVQQYFADEENESEVLAALFESSAQIVWWDVSLACGIGVVLSVVASYIHHFKLINRFGQRISATNRYGDEDVWSFFLNAEDLSGWVFVRDHKEDLVYYGWLQAWSESGEDRELIMDDVEVVSNETGDTLYKVSSMYVARDGTDLTIEIPPPRADAS